MGCKLKCTVNPSIRKCCLECEKYKECTVVCDDLDSYELTENCTDYVEW